ncbi:hypothetical protein QCA50_019109 [Cerrena zonata]|uniref:Uncharacterized protein n=1 Tax=Cerrena zonata TaxID=2478898 RepID=A0AAW0FID4_9APHY
MFDDDIVLRSHKYMDTPRRRLDFNEYTHNYNATPTDTRHEWWERDRYREEKKWLRDDLSQLRRKQEDTELELKTLKEAYDKLLGVIGDLGSTENPTKLTSQSPQPILKEELPNIQYYTKKEYSEALQNGIAAKINSLDGTNRQYTYLELHDGTIARDILLKEISIHANAIFHKLLVANILPETWGKATLDIHNCVFDEMEHKFELFCYCEHRWKVQRYTTLQYPGWKQKHMHASIKEEEDSALMTTKNLKRSSTSVKSPAGADSDPLLKKIKANPLGGQDVVETENEGMIEMMHTRLETRF